MRERIERMRNSPSILRRGIWRLCKFSSRILSAKKRGEIIMWLKRTIRYRPKYCRKVSGWGLNVEERSPRIIVSLTSYPGRIKTVHRVIVSLLNQTMKPDKVVLWLGEDKFPAREDELPKKLLALRKYGLTIAWCKDLRSYTKLIPSLKLYPEDIIVTVDDDNFYSRQLIERLYASYQLDRKSIHCNKVRRIATNSEGHPLPYVNWTMNVPPGTKSHSYLLLGYAGVLYPPHVLDADVICEQKFASLAPSADDLWFWAMAVNAGTMICLAAQPSEICDYDCCSNQDDALMKQNVDGVMANNVQFRAIIDAYPQVAAYSILNPSNCRP